MSFVIIVLSDVTSEIITANGLRLKKVGDFEALIFF